MTSPAPDVRQDRPIGYWIKLIDASVEADFARLLAGEGLNRRGWQVLNTLSRGPAGGPQLDAALGPFLSAGEPTVTGHADALTARGWAQRTPAGAYELTATGRAAHARVSAKVHTARARIIDGLTAEDYGTLVGLLRRVAANVAEKPDEPERPRE